MSAAAPAPSPLPTAATTPSPLPRWSHDLLALAFEAASAFPLDPHRKNRSRAQEQVVVACFQLGQPELALAFAGRIQDWRRGAAYADYAREMARRGDAARARDYVARAEEVVREEQQDINSQPWRRDLIWLKVARALEALGDTEGARKAMAGIDEASANAVDGAWANVAAAPGDATTREQAAAALTALALDFAQLPLGRQHVALVTLTRLHETHFDDLRLRADCERLVGATWTKAPPPLRLQSLAAMVRTSVAHGRGDGARALLTVMQGILDGHVWRAEDRFPEVARLIELAIAVGDHEQARAAAERALADWHAQRAAIVDIYRARSLRPLALAWHTLGEPARCQELLALVVEEGMENPNSRPRCDDLVDTCVALATRGIEPAPALSERLREIQRGLGNPW